VILYPADFIAACKEEFPLATELHDWLEAGDERAGHHLDHARQISSSPIRTRLYRQWCSIINQNDRPSVKTQRIERKK
jgi:hypothetical protein